MAQVNFLFLVGVGPISPRRTWVPDLHNQYLAWTTVYTNRTHGTHSFQISSYGSILLGHFSGVAVTGRKNTPWSYCAHLYHTMKQVCDWRFYLVIITFSVQSSGLQHLAGLQNLWHRRSNDLRSERMRQRCLTLPLFAPERPSLHLQRSGWRSVFHP